MSFLWEVLGASLTSLDLPLVGLLSLSCTNKGSSLESYWESPCNTFSRKAHLRITLHNPLLEHNQRLM